MRKIELRELLVRRTRMVAFLSGLKNLRLFTYANVFGKNLADSCRVLRKIYAGRLKKVVFFFSYYGDICITRLFKHFAALLCKYLLND